MVYLLVHMYRTTMHPDNTPAPHIPTHPTPTHTHSQKMYQTLAILSENYYIL
jgi:hypothetical protein